MSFKVTTNGGLELARPRSVTDLQTFVLQFMGKLPLYIRDARKDALPIGVVLTIPTTRTPLLTIQGSPVPLDYTYIGWVDQLTTAVSNATGVSNDHDHTPA